MQVSELNTSIICIKDFSASWTEFENQVFYNIFALYQTPETSCNVDVQLNELNDFPFKFAL